MNEKKQGYQVYTFSLFKHLFDLRFTLLGTFQCYENPRKTVFVFEDSPALREAVRRYTLEYGDKKRDEQGRL